MRVKHRIYNLLLARYKKSIEKSRLQGKDKIIFLAKELVGELHRQGYKMDSCDIPVHVDIYQHKGMGLEVQHIINGWSIREGRD